MSITRDVKAQVRQGLDEKRIGSCLIMLAELLEDLEKRLRVMGRLTVEGQQAMKSVLAAVGQTGEMLGIVGEALSPEITKKLSRFQHDPNVAVGSESPPAPGSPLLGLSKDS